MLYWVNIFIQCVILAVFYFTNNFNTETFKILLAIIQIDNERITNLELRIKELTNEQ